MEKLEQIINGYNDLFHKTGKVEFFIRAKNIERLKKNISLIETLEKEDGLIL